MVVGAKLSLRKKWPRLGHAGPGFRPRQAEIFREVSSFARTVTRIRKTHPSTSGLGGAPLRNGDHGRGMMVTSALVSVPALQAWPPLVRFGSLSIRVRFTTAILLALESASTAIASWLPFGL